MPRMPPPISPTVWFTKNINPTLQRVREVAQSGRYRVLASHTSPDASYLGAAQAAFVEPTDIEPEEYPDYALEVVRRYQVQALIGGRNVATLAERRADFEALGCRLILPSRSSQSFERCYDKADFYQMFSERLPMPETRSVQSWEALRLAARDLEARHGSACFKPARGIYGLGFRILSDGNELKRFLGGDQLRLSYAAAELLLAGQDLPTLLVMQTLPGVEYSVDALSHGGELRTLVMRRKDGGLGNVQTAVDDSRLREWTALLARDLEMDGLFNAQFKEDADGLPRLLEVNARASGGLSISAALSGLKLGLLEVDAHFGFPLGDLAFAPGKRVTQASEVIELRPAGTAVDPLVTPATLS